MSGVSPGTTVVTAHSSGSGISASATITILNVPAASITIAPAFGSVYLDGSLQLSATVRDSAGGLLSRSVTWTSSDPATAEVSPLGSLKGMRVGTVSITAASDPAVKSVSFTVVPGDQLAFTEVSGAFPRVVTMNADGSGVVIATADNGFNYYTAWAPDGKRIATASAINGYVLRIATVGNPLVQQLPATASSHMSEPEWSPSNEEIAYVAGTLPATIVYVVDLNSGVQRRISTLSDAVQPHWSPDGQRLAYQSAGRVVVNNRLGTAESPVSALFPQDAQAHCWTGNNSLVIWQYELFSATIGAGGDVALKKLTNIGIQNNAIMGCSRSGRVALAPKVNTTNGARAVYVVNADGTGVTRTEMPEAYYDTLSWSSDGKRLFATATLVGGGNRLYAMDEQGHVTTLRSGTGSAYVSWNPAR